MQLHLTCACLVCSLLSFMFCLFKISAIIRQLHVLLSFTEHLDAKIPCTPLTSLVLWRLMSSCCTCWSPGFWPTHNHWPKSKPNMQVAWAHQTFGNTCLPLSAWLHGFVRDPLELITGWPQWWGHNSYLLSFSSVKENEVEIVLYLIFIKENFHVHPWHRIFYI